MTDPIKKHDITMLDFITGRFDRSGLQHRYELKKYIARKMKPITTTIRLEDGWSGKEKK